MPGHLYRYWSSSGTLLYIGISLNAVARLGQHRDKDWFPRIETIKVQKFDTYAEAEIAKLRAICYEGPIHNVRGSRDAKDLGPALAKLRAARRRSASRGPLKKLTKLRKAYNIDLIFGAIPSDMSFESYAEQS